MSKAGNSSGILAVATPTRRRNRRNEQWLWEEHIATLREAESGKSVKDVGRQLGFSEATFYQ